MGVVDLSEPRSSPCGGITVCINPRLSDSGFLPYCLPLCFKVGIGLN